MATLVFRLKFVPDDEADEIRQLLAEHDIAFYETSAGRWQISMAGIWVKDKQQALLARQLINEDQQQRAQSHRPISWSDALLGYLQHAKQNPVECVFTLIAIALVLTLSVYPFLVWH
ncbi:DUF6164 family protein [Marinomonas epiphytica]